MDQAHVLIRLCEIEEKHLSRFGKQHSQDYYMQMECDYHEKNKLIKKENII